MFHRFMGGAAVIALAVSGTVVAAAPASAAAKCAAGSWRLTAEKNEFYGAAETGAFKGRTSGLAGQRLTVKGDRVTFDFAKAAPENTVYTGAKPETYRNTYRGTLTAKVKITGSAKGKLTVYPKTAKGTAKAKVVQLKPKRKEWGSYNVVKMIRDGGTETVLPFGYSYTCTKTALKFTLTSSGENEFGAFGGTFRLTYKRR
ncbi:hypothetical protein EDD29_1597 [Actinocorallia herbida]|uniref:Uncharacterized protein n=1 Tax=Actinocorallia herbida TaxID=58109 RepID=A0A3N1CSA8_9ACTN|nr:hypothetical protein [Actinocorallia herbida]ROO84085.1 hypothetical protein EDD29_1597 [Actinocorallia herbida]